MKINKSASLALAIAVSLAACSDNKNEETASGAESSTSNVVSNKITKKAEGDSFKKMLTYVPADTAYLLTNQKPVPEDVLEFHLKRSKQMLLLWKDFLKDAQSLSKKKAEDSAGELAEKPADQEGAEKAETATSETELSSAQPDDKTGDFFLALLDDLMANMSVDKITNTGVKVDGHSAIYGVDLAPVLRYEISSKDAVMDTLERAEKASGYNVEWKKCGEFDCIEKTDDKSAKKNGFVVVLQDDQVAAGLFSADNKQAVMDHLIGKSKPNASYPVSNWSQFLSDNKYAGYGDGYVDLKKVYSTLEQLILEEEKKKAEQAGKPFDAEATKACAALVKRHIEHVPEAVFGIKKLQARAMDYEVVLKTSPVVSTAVGAIANPLTGMQQAKNPVFDLGLNLNFGKLREGLTQYTNFLVSSAEELKCDAVKADEVRKAMGGFTMATMMGVNQFKAIYVSVNDLKMGANGQPEKMDIYASIFADQPAALLQMLAMVNPAFASIKLPTDGTATKLPEGLIPPNPTGVNPEIYLSQKDQLLNIMVGDMKPELKPFKTEQPAFLWSTVDSKRYYDIIGNVMKTAQTMQGKPGANELSAEDQEAQKAIDMLSKMKEFTGVVHTQMGADTRGVAINYAVEYE